MIGGFSPPKSGVGADNQLIELGLRVRFVVVQGARECRQEIERHAKFTQPS